MTNELHRVVSELNFDQWHDVRERASIADLFRPNERCGIYVLSFANGEAYAGQAVDVTRRYVQHRKVHPDIEAMAFQTVTVDGLDQKGPCMFSRYHCFNLADRFYDTEAVPS